MGYRCGLSTVRPSTSRGTKRRHWRRSILSLSSFQNHPPSLSYSFKPPSSTKTKENLTSFDFLLIHNDNIVGWFIELQNTCLLVSKLLPLLTLFLVLISCFSWAGVLRPSLTSHFISSHPPQKYFKTLIFLFISFRFVFQSGWGVGSFRKILLPADQVHGRV